MDESARQLELVRLTFRNGLRNCVHWEEPARRRFMTEGEFAGLTDVKVIDLLMNWVNFSGLHVALSRGADSHVAYEHLFYAVIAMDGYANGLYVKFALLDDDKDYPEVVIVSCHRTSHPQRS